ncbi:hypothetical protein ES703_71932 [subsurface metagenome]
MVCAQSLPLCLDKPDIVGIVAADLLPIIPKVALNVVFSFQFQISLLYLFQQGAIVPGGAIKNRGHVGG